MAETSSADKKDSLEDNSSSEEWTIIYKKEHKSNSKDTDSVACSQKLDVAVASEIEEKIDSEHVDLENTNEKENDSDDVSILSDESDPEHVSFEERIEKVEVWQDNRRLSCQFKALAMKTETDGNPSSNGLVVCSIIAIIIGIVIAGQVLEFRENKPNYSVNTEIENKLQELSRIEEKLKELYDVKQVVEQIRINMPDMKMLKDQLANHMYQNIKPKFFNKENINLEKLKEHNILHSNHYDDTLETLETTYENICFAINSSKPINEFCKTPKILLKMMSFKKNLRQALEQTQEIVSVEKRIFEDVGRKLDAASMSLLTDFSMIFSKFSLKVEERLNKFDYKLQRKLCTLKTNGKSQDNFFNILLNNQILLNNCNDILSSDSIKIDLKSNITWKDDYKIKNSFYDEPKKYTNPRNAKDYKIAKDSREYYSYEKQNNQETQNVKSKGEVKNNNNWKQSIQENNNAKFYEDEKKYHKYEQHYNNNKGYEKRSSDKHNNSFEINNSNYVIEHNFENRNNENINSFENRNNDNINSFDNCKKDGDNGSAFKQDQKHNHQYEDAYQDANEDKISVSNFESNINSDDLKYEHSIKNHNFDQNGYNEFIQNEEKQKFKRNKEIVEKPHNFKENKYIKYNGHQGKDRNSKYYQHNGDWQTQRGERKANSDWYFVRADSRQKARTNVHEAIVEKEEAVAEPLASLSPPPRTPPTPQKAKNWEKNNRHRRATWDNLRKRIMRDVLEGARELLEDFV